MNKLHTITNHPVHIFDDNGNPSPSAFIPFCQFGKSKNVSAMGMKTDLFSVPVCNSFKAKIFYNQLCYEVDVKDIFKKNHFTSTELELGLSFLVDTNFNRQYSMERTADRTTLNETIGKETRRETVNLNNQ